MELKKRFGGYRRFLTWEGILKSALYGICAGSAAVLITSIIYHVLIKQNDLLILWIFIGAFLMTAPAIFFLRYYPSLKRTASRIDRDIQLEDRMGTMVEYWDKDGLMAQLQREDALGKLDGTSPKDLKIKIKKLLLIPVIITTVLAIITLFIPYNILEKETPEDLDAARAEWVSSLLEDLREEAMKMEENEEVKSAVDEILSDLEEALQGSSGDLESAGEISEAILDLQKLLDQYVTRDEIGEALQRHKLTRELGEAISDGDTEAVSKAMANLYSKVNGDNTQITELAANIKAALEESGVDSTDELYTALDDFALALEMNTISTTPRLKEDFDTAEEAIIAALETQAELEAYINSIMESLETAKEDMLGEGEGGEGEPDGEKPDGEKPDGERPNGEMPEGQMPEGEMPEGEIPEGDFGDGEEINENMTEAFYDPISGSVEYGDVFASYYYEYLEALAKGDVSEDLQDIIDAYFDSLSK